MDRGIRAHGDTKIGWNAIKGYKVINNFSPKITLICCHTYTVNF